jgi:hypothetical protein
MRDSVAEQSSDITFDLFHVKISVYASDCEILHIPISNLTLFQYGVWYSSIKTYNHLPLTLKELSNDIFKFKAALIQFILKNLFYTLEEYYSWK